MVISTSKKIKFPCSFYEWSTFGCFDRRAIYNSTSVSLELISEHLNMDKLFQKICIGQNSLATSKLESRYSQIKPAFGFNDPTE